MKTIGIIGGISWLSSAEYYRIINEKINEALGGVNAGKIILYSVNYEEIKNLTFAGNWNAVSDIMCDIAKKLEAAGADCLLLGANTMHKLAGEVASVISIPLLHIAAVTGAAINNKGIRKVALLGTKYTMEMGFYQQQLDKFGIETVLPDAGDRAYIHDAIYNELGKNIFLPATKHRFVTIIDKLQSDGVAGIILGCTEIPLLLNQQDCSIPVFDTTQLHAEAAVAFALTAIPALKLQD